MSAIFDMALRIDLAPLLEAARKERGNAGNYRLRGRGPDGGAEEVADEGYHRRGGEKFPSAAGSRDRADRRIEKGLEGERRGALYRTVSWRADARCHHRALRRTRREPIHATLAQATTRKKRGMARSANLG
jgi:hypothetical protein